MPPKEPHYAVQFASRYRNQGRDFFDAWTAMLRIDELIEDAKNQKLKKEMINSENEHWSPWFDSEIFSYYAVGFVTCFEWHARSRLVDLLNFKPKATKPEDLKILKDKVVLDMIEANVTVASIVGASTNISSLESYISVFNRLFYEFDEKFNVYDAFKTKHPTEQKNWIESGQIDELKNLFRFRNDLVHEIGIHRVGHLNIRDCWSLDEVIRIGEIVKRAMQSIETAISEKMPDKFPNILSEEGYPKSEADILEKEIPDLENTIEKFARDLVGVDISNDRDWKRAKVTARVNIKNELSLLDKALFLHNRYVNLRDPLKLIVVKNRHSYLSSIVDTITNAWGLEENFEASEPSEETQ